MTRLAMGFHSTRVFVLAATVLTVALVVSRIRRFLVRRQFARLHGCKPIVRRSNKDPFFGLDRIYSFIQAAQERKALEKARERHRALNYTFTSKQMLNHSILTSEPENIKTILSINFKHYGLGFRLKHFEPLLGKGIFDTDGDHWAMSRALIRPNFTRDQVADLASFEHLIKDFFALIPRDGYTVVDLQSLFFRYTIDSATEFLFGQSVGSLRMTGPDLNFAEAFNYSQEAITTRGMLGPLRRFHRDPKADQCNRICREFAQQFVDEAVRTVQSEEKEDKNEDSETKRRKYIFSHELARRTSDKRRILDELMNVLLAGRDTTASMLSNMFFMLAKHPAVWTKLRREVASLEGRLPTYEELRNLKYLRCCMNECERYSFFLPSRHH
jgi:cytochrome P450